MKTLALFFLLASAAVAASPSSLYTVSDLELLGAIDGNNIRFTLSFQVETQSRRQTIPLVKGSIAALAMPDSERFELRRTDDGYAVYIPRRGRHTIRFEFASRASHESEHWRATCFELPDAPIRTFRITSRRPDLQVDVVEALKLSREGDEHGVAFSGHLKPGAKFTVRWQPKIEELISELSVVSEARSVAVASAGVLRLDNHYQYQIVQGKLKALRFEVPAQLNVTQVHGEDIQDWRIDEGAAGRQLRVTLGRAKPNSYQLHVESEMGLPEFPSTFDFPMMRPLDVMRCSGFLAAGTDAAVRIQTGQVSGLSQIDKHAFPMAEGMQMRALPTGSLFTATFANLPFALSMTADHITTSLYADTQLAAVVSDNGLALHAAVELDIRDAAIREQRFQVPPGMSVAKLQGAKVADHYLEPAADGKHAALRVLFAEPVIGKVLLSLRLERSLDEHMPARMPFVRTENANTERGFVVLAAVDGWQVKAKETTGLRSVHTGSVPLRAKGASSAYRFKNASWAGMLDVSRRPSALYTEMFHLCSLSDNVSYGSTIMTCHVSGAPIDKFKVRIPEDCGNIEFVGRHIRHWRRAGDSWEVVLQEKVVGDYTLLVTYDQRYSASARRLTVGAIEMPDAVTESGYLAITGASGLYLESEALADSLFTIDSEEIPDSYRVMINAPVLSAYKFVKAPHAATVAVRAYDSASLVSMLVDHTRLQSRINENGEVVTEASYWVKNANHQHLALRLPKAATLWHASVDGVGVRAAWNEEQLLIPLARHRDPNRAMQVAVTYATRGTGLAALSELSLESPATSAQSTFTEWGLTLPAAYSLQSVSGNMRAHQQVAPQQSYTRSIEQMLFLLKAVATRPALWGAVLGFFVMSAVLVYALARRRFRTLAIVMVVGFMAAEVHWLGQQDWSTWLPTVEVPSRLHDFHFSKSISPAGEVLQIGGQVVASKADVGVRHQHAMFYGGLAILALLVACYTRWFLPLVVAILSAHHACVGWPAAEFWFATVVVVAAPLLVLTRLLLMLWRLGSAPAELGAAVRPVPAMLAVFFVLVTVSVCRAEELPVPDVEPLAVTVVEPCTGQYREVTLDIRAELAPDEPTVAVAARMMIHATKRGESFPVAPAGSVVTDIEYDHRQVELVREGGHDVFITRRRGTFTVDVGYIFPIAEQHERFSLQMTAPSAIRSRARVRIPRTRIDVTSSEAVAMDVEVVADATIVDMVLGLHDRVELSWQPETRKTEREQAVFYAETQSLAVFDDGVVELEHRVAMQVAQGELRRAEFKIPVAQSVTSVSTPNLHTWRYDPEQQLLEVIWSKPVVGSAELQIDCQRALERLPYETEIAVVTAIGSTRQRGGIAAAAAPGVRIVPGDSSNLSHINTADFPIRSFAMTMSGRKPIHPVYLPYRYHRLPARLVIGARAIEPEIRVGNQSNLAVGDERLVLNTKLQVEIAKAGVFQINLSLPAGYDIESLVGTNVRHWSERLGDEKGVVVHFDKRLTGQCTLNIVLSRPVEREWPTLELPRVSVANEMKHTGTFLVSSDIGVRLTVQSREGATELNPNELGTVRKGVLAFRLLRPSWKIELHREVVAPWIQAEVLQSVQVNDGLLRGTAHIHYKLENAGSKRFVISPPANVASLDIYGDEVARTERRDDGNWEVELHRKVLREYSLRVQYQHHLEDDEPTVDILPVRCQGVDLQKGYLALFSHPRLNVDVVKVEGDLKPFDARAVPSDFVSDDWSGATHCYRTMDPDFRLRIVVTRYQAAEALPAQVKRVVLQTVVTRDGQQMTQMRVAMHAGHKRFLQVALPPGSTAWTAFVNRTAVQPSATDSQIMIPLEQAIDRALVLDVELTYTTKAPGAWLPTRPMLRGPRIDLPLRNVEWLVYVPPEQEYDAFEGTLTYIPPVDKQSIFSWGDQQYQVQSSASDQATTARAKDLLDSGAAWARSGKRNKAKKAFATAMQLSMGEADLNEDARVQLRNVQRQQAIVGLVKCRGDFRARNVLDGESVVLIDDNQFNEGAFSEQFARQVEQALTVDESAALIDVADRLMEQQNAADAKRHPMHVSFPQEGRLLRFERGLFVSPSAGLTVAMVAAPEQIWWGKERWQKLVAFAACVILLCIFACGGVTWRVPQRRTSAS